jgi:hypothetical protein
MARKSLALSKNDPLVEQFDAGLRAWEHPYGEPDAPEGDAPGEARKAKTFRARVVRTGELKAPRVEALPDDDPVVERFRKGLARWENPFGGGGEDE